jgi:AcrR family transcriptional regulator
MSGPAKPRLPAAERRASIVDTAVDLFARRGFLGTTTRELAAACGISEPVLYQHFDTKRALYDAILESKSSPDGVQAFFAAVEAIEGSGDNRAYFTYLGNCLLNWYIQDPRYARLLMYSALESHELSDLFYQRTVAVFYDIVTHHIQRQIDQGRFHPTDPLLAARLFAGMIAHQGVIFAIYHPGHLPASRDQIVQAAVDIFLKGIEL